MTRSEVDEKCIEVHKKLPLAPVKIDAMFFAATEETLILQGEAIPGDDTDAEAAAAVGAAGTYSS